LRVERRGPWVFKFLRPHDAFEGETAADRLRQIRLRVRESWLHAELNPLAYDETANCLVSRYIDGRIAGTRESDALVRAVLASKRGYLVDLNPFNLRITPAGPIAVDFAIAEGHADWKDSPDSHRRPTHYRLTQE
jgi:hypothetical protein